jgi:muramidase (phage lysozyme)
MDARPILFGAGVGLLAWVMMGRKETLESWGAGEFLNASLTPVNGGAELKLSDSFESANWNNAAKVPDSLRFNPQVMAFMRVIREGESSQGPEAYYMMNGGKLFTKANGFISDLTNIPHPGFIVKPGTSTAAGAFQVVRGSWGHMSRFRDLGENAVMTPANQEKVALALLAWRGALPAVMRGDIETALKKIPDEWEAFKPAKMIQQGKTVAHYKAVFKKYGGTLAAGQ